MGRLHRARSGRCCTSALAGAVNSRHLLSASLRAHYSSHSPACRRAPFRSNGVESRRVRRSNAMSSRPARPRLPNKTAARARSSAPTFAALEPGAPRPVNLIRLSWRLERAAIAVSFLALAVETRSWHRELRAQSSPPLPNDAPSRSRVSSVHAVSRVAVLSLCPPSRHGPSSQSSHSAVPRIAVLPLCRPSHRCEAALGIHRPACDLKPGAIVPSCLAPSLSVRSRARRHRPLVPLLCLAIAMRPRDRNAPPNRTASLRMRARHSQRTLQ